jgi:hypothetical protein
MIAIVPLGDDRRPEHLRNLISGFWLFCLALYFSPGFVDVDGKHQLVSVTMEATQRLGETIDRLDVSAVGLMKNDQPDVDEEDSADEEQDLVDTNTSTKKKKKKKPKKKVSSPSARSGL